MRKVAFPLWKEFARCATNYSVVKYGDWKAGFGRAMAVMHPDVQVSAILDEDLKRVWRSGEPPHVYAKRFDPSTVRFIHQVPGWKIPVPGWAAALIVLTGVVFIAIDAVNSLSSDNPRSFIDDIFFPGGSEAARKAESEREMEVGRRTMEAMEYDRILDAGYDQVRQGYTIESVYELIPMAPDTAAENEQPGLRTVTVTWTAKGSETHYSILFKNGRVAMKTRDSL